MDKKAEIKTELRKIEQSKQVIEEARKELGLSMDNAIDEINLERSNIDLTDVFTDMFIITEVLHIRDGIIDESRS